MDIRGDPWSPIARSERRAGIQEQKEKIEEIAKPRPKLFSRLTQNHSTYQEILLEGPPKKSARLAAGFFSLRTFES